MDKQKKLYEEETIDYLQGRIDRLRSIEGEDTVMEEPSVAKSSTTGKSKEEIKAERAAAERARTKDKNAAFRTLFKLIPEAGDSQVEILNATIASLKQKNEQVADLKLDQEIMRLHYEEREAIYREETEKTHEEHLQAYREQLNEALRQIDEYKMQRETKTEQKVQSSGSQKEESSGSQKMKETVKKTWAKIKRKRQNTNNGNGNNK